MEGSEASHSFTLLYNKKMNRNRVACLHLFINSELTVLYMHDKCVRGNKMYLFNTQKNNVRKHSSFKIESVLLLFLNNSALTPKKSIYTHSILARAIRLYLLSTYLL
jgi:hypothetical protein